MVDLTFGLHCAMLFGKHCENGNESSSEMCRWRRSVSTAKISKVANAKGEKEGRAGA